MKNDIGKVSFDELNHFVGVFHQMGRLPLESDFNEQNELVLRLMQRAAGDALHTGSPNQGFCVDTHVVIDKLESRRGWAALPATASVFIDYFDHRVGDGCLVVQGATEVAKTLPSSIDLSQAVELLVLLKTVPAVPFTLFVGDGSSRHDFTMSTVAIADGWTLARAVPGAWPAGFAAQAIVEYGFRGLTALARYSFDVIKADLPLRRLLVRPGLTGSYTALPTNAVLAGDDDQRLWRECAIRASLASAVTHRLAAPCDASRARRLLVSVQRSPAAAAFSVTLQDGNTPAASLALSAAVVTVVTPMAGSSPWEVHTFTLPQAGGFDWTGLARLTYAGLDASASYRFGPVLLEADPALDLVVMGGDGSSAGAGRFHGEGLCATQEAHGSYFSQPDLPQPDPTALAPVVAGQKRTDWAYLDLWERPLSYVERPALRDVALDGPDTCTRTQLVAQVRLLAGTAVALVGTAVPPSDAFAMLPRIGLGLLSTKDKPAAGLDPCADPCEPVIKGPYLGEENRLFRVEIHRAGGIGAANAVGTAGFKWSRENAGVVSALITDAALAATSVEVEKPELFAIGDLVELADDRVELITGPFEDRLTHTNHVRGELRKVVTVNLQTRRISWDDAGIVDPREVPFHAALLRPLYLQWHAKLTRWDGVAACTAGDIVLADGVVIEFGGQAMVPGDHWLFATRTLDRSVERLIEAPARGIRHNYFPLAAIQRSRAAALTPERVFCEDLRPRFTELPRLDASRIAYDPGACAAEHHIDGWNEVSTVQQAIDALCRADLTGDLRLHNKLLHGFGVVCGLKLRCSKDREQLLMTKGYALDCEGDLLHLGGERAVPVVERAIAQGLLDAAGDGKINLWITQATNGVATHIEPNVPQNFWNAVLEGSLLKDFFDNTILALINFLKAELLPFPDATLPLSDAHKRVISLLNLVWQMLNSASGPYVFLSKAEHDLLEGFHTRLVEKLAERTPYCALFDNLQPFPDYPYSVPTGIDTMFGMFLLHQKVKLDPANTYACTYGTGNRIQFIDIASRQAVAITTFPGASNLTVRDIAFNAAGTRVHVVGTLQNGSDIDSVFATADITPPVAPAVAPTLTWGPAMVVCKIDFVTMHGHASTTDVFAIGRHASVAASRGLYRFDPDAVPITPIPAVAFNATGLLAIDTDGVHAVATERSGGLQDGSFDLLRRVNLGSLLTSTPFSATGQNAQADLAIANGSIFLTGTSAGLSVLYRFLLAPEQSLGATPLGAPSTWRLGLLPSRNLLLLADANRYLARQFNTATATLSATVRVPLQIMPISLAIGRGERHLYALNLLPGTVNAIDIGALLATTPSFTNEPPVTLKAYRDKALESFTDLIGILGQYVKDGWCEQFLIECKECSREDKVYLGTIEIRGRRVHHICNFSKRHYAKSFRTWGYWLSALPLLPMVKQAFAKFCCVKLVP